MKALATIIVLGLLAAGAAFYVATETTILEDNNITNPFNDIKSQLKSISDADKEVVVKTSENTYSVYPSENQMALIMKETEIDGSHAQAMLDASAHKLKR